MKQKKYFFQKDSRTKRMILITFIVSVLIITVISYTSFESFSTLTTSIDQLSRPDIRRELLNQTTQEIYEAENYIQTYILTNDPSLEKKYNDHISSAYDKMKLLKTLLISSHQRKRVDSLESLFNNKLKYLSAYLKLKNQKQAANYSGQALEQIQKQLDDSTLYSMQFFTTEKLKGEFQPTEHLEVVIIPDEYKGLKGFFRKLLGGDQSTIDTLISHKEQLFLTKEIKVDTTTVKSHSPDSALNLAKEILSDYAAKEKWMQQQLAKRELALLLQNQVFITKMKAIIHDLYQTERTEHSLRNKEAKRIGTEAVHIILFAGLFGLILCGILLTLIIKDVTRSYFLSKQLEKEKTKAEDLAKMKEEFLANMSHEIRTPLQSIKGFSELMSQSSLNDQQTKFMLAINQSNNHLSALINNILDQAKIDAGMMQIVNLNFNLVTILEEIESLFSPMIQEKGLKWQLYYTNNLKELTLIGDAIRIKQVLTNLIHNAIKFTNEGTISLSVSGQQINAILHLEITVKDTGVGISSKLKDSVFKEFTQEANQNSEGTGLGLSIVKGLLKEMKGTVTLESETGLGAAFTVKLNVPVTNSKHLESTNKGIPLLASDANIIIVEDDGWSALLLKEILTKRVKKVYTFNRAEDALESIIDNPELFHLIFTDIKMPGMGGISFMKQVKKINPDLPVIALTAHLQIEKLKDLTGQGFEEVKSKPYKKQDIIKILNRLFIQADQMKEDNPNPQKNSEIYRSEIDLSNIKSFSENHFETFNKIWSQFIENNERQVCAFKKSFQSGDFQKLGDIAHQMKASYDQVGLIKISESLASIELHILRGNNQKAIDIAKSIEEQLRFILQDFKLLDLKDQFHNDVSYSTK